MFKKKKNPPLLSSPESITFINFDTNTTPDIYQKKMEEKKINKGYKTKTKMENVVLAREKDNCNLG